MTKTLSLTIYSANQVGASFYDLDDYEEALSDYNESLKTLTERKVKDMTLGELAKTLKEQAKLL